MNTFSFWYNGSQTMMYGEEFQLMFSCYFDFPEYPFEVPYSRHYKRQLIFFQPTFLDGILVNITIYVVNQAIFHI